MLRYWDMTGLACLFWTNDSSKEGGLEPALLVLYIPGQLLRQVAPLQAEALRNQARAMVDAAVAGVRVCHAGQKEQFKDSPLGPPKT